MTEVIVKILVELIRTLAVATKQVKQGRLSESVFGRYLTRFNDTQRNSERSCLAIMRSRRCYIDWTG
jgi:hypothetical protein